MGKSMSFGEWLGRCREALGLTQIQFATRLSYAVSFYRKIEQGQQPSKQFIERLIDELDASAQERATLAAFAKTGTCEHPEALLFQILARMHPLPSRTPEHLFILPQLPSRLIGRDTELAELLALLREPGCRLVTLLGPPGVGKTHLALHTAAALAQDVTAFIDGIVFVSLAALTDPQLVISTIAATLEVREVGDQSLLLTLCNFLRNRQLLLVLDNLEQVLEAAPLLMKVRSSCPQVTFLATSRAPLKLRGEQQYPISPLDLPDLACLPEPMALTRTPAVALFVERAQAVLHHFRLTEENRIAVATLCVRLDGLPLALELVARHVKLLSPDQILTQMNRRLELLTIEVIDLPGRHQSLRAALDESYALLGAAEQTIFRRLAVFAGGCTLEGAEQVVGAAEFAPIQVQKCMQALLDQSLLYSFPMAAGTVRVHMLETVRVYALEMLEASGEQRAVEQAFSAYLCTLAEQAEEALRSPQQGVWLARLRAEQDNLRAALTTARMNKDRVTLLRLSAALGRFWSLAGAFREGCQWLEWALEFRDSLPKPLVAKAFNRLGWLMTRQGNFIPARQTLEQSVALWRAVGEPRGLAQALNDLCVPLLEQGEHAAAEAALDECIKLRRELGDQSGLIDPLCNRGIIAMLRKEIARARESHVESLTFSRVAGSKSQVAMALNNLAWVLIVEDRCAQTLDLLQESLTLSRELEMEHYRASVFNNLGVVEMDRGNLKQASTYITESLAIRRDVGDQLGMAENLYALAAVAAQQQRLRRTARLLGAMAILRTQVGVSPADDQRIVYERYLAPTRAQADPTLWEVDLAYGTMMGLANVITYALGDED